MCDIKSFEDLMEKYDAKCAGEHLRDCPSCRKDYSNLFEMLYPDLPIESFVIKKQKQRAFSFRLIPLAGLGLALLILFLFSTEKNSSNNGFDDSFYDALSYSDCIEIVDNMDEGSFDEILNYLKEDL